MARPGPRLSLAVFLAWVVVLALVAPGADYFFYSFDHGQQLALGNQVLHGKIPGVDTFNHYGPLVVYVSAAAQGLAPPLLGESISCTLGHAAALLALHLALARSSGAAWGLAGSIYGFLALPRLYKWYVWLCPLLVLVAFQSWLASADRRRPSWWLGLALGTTWLFRPDMGFTCAAGVGAVALVLEVRRHAWTGALPVLVRIAAGTCLPIAAWLAFTWLARGAGAPVYFLRSTILGGLFVADDLGTAWPRFVASRPLSQASLRVMAYAGLLATYAVALLVGLAAELRGQRHGTGASARARTLLAAGVVGLAVLHQALHRKDGPHLLQVLAPWIVAAFTLTDVLARALLQRTQARARWAAVTIAWLILAAWTGVGPLLWGRIDLASFEISPALRYASLVHPLRGRAPDPNLIAVRRLRELTQPDDAILIYPLNPQLYPLADRRMSGMLFGYYAGVFSEPPWSEDNLRSIRADPPRVILVPSGFHGELDPEVESDRHRASHAYMEDFLRERYTRVLFDDGHNILLAGS